MATWRFVMGRDVKPLVEFEDQVDMRDRMPLVGELRNEMCDEFLKRLHEMTGKKYSFPTYFQWEKARRQGVLNDLGEKLEIFYTHTSAVTASGKKKITIRTFLWRNRFLMDWLSTCSNKGLIFNENCKIYNVRKYRFTQM